MSDVAIIEVGCHANRHVGMFVNGGWRYGDDKWVANDPAIVTVVRPLVVIDLEPNQAQFVIDVLEQTRHEWTLKLASALRPLARPDEPTGLGAVVEDDKGRHWVRVGELGDAGADDWKRAGAGHNPAPSNHYGWATYATIAAVKVLSEGVTP